MVKRRQQGGLMIVDVYKGDIYIYYMIFIYIYIVNPVKLCDKKIQTLQFFFGGETSNLNHRQVRRRGDWWLLDLGCCLADRGGTRQVWGIPERKKPQKEGHVAPFENLWKK